jgi:hypothetical protein
MSSFGASALRNPSDTTQDFKMLFDSLLRKVEKFLGASLDTCVQGTMATVQTQLKAALAEVDGTQLPSVKCYLKVLILGTLPQPRRSPAEKPLIVTIPCACSAVSRQPIKKDYDFGAEA